LAESIRRLAGKIALVTGGGRGIGRAIALAFAKEGADICVVARTESEIQDVAKEVEALGQKALAVVADVTDRGQVGKMAEQVSKGFCRVDILVNNAGGGGESGPILSSDPDAWTKVVNVNLMSAYLVTHAILHLMTDAGGRIINVGSGMGHRSGTGSSAYRVGKAGLWMLTCCLAEELWENGIEVNELIPGPVATDATKKHFRVGGAPPFAPSERVKTPEEVTPLALWLATQGPGGPTAQSFSLTRRPI
jgi:3-oxoacyl-[acyl-carrier protein] reductase